MKRTQERRKRDREGIVEGAAHTLERGWSAVRGAMAASDTDALALLRAQHANVETLFSQFERVVERDRRRAVALVHELDEALTMHAEIEEKIFYPAVRVPKTEDLVAESFEEHRQMKRALADAVAAARGDDGDDLAAAVSALKEDVIHHAKEEEEAKLFPIVRSLLDEDQREALGQQMVAAMVEMQERGGVSIRSSSQRGQHAST